MKHRIVLLLLILAASEASAQFPGDGPPPPQGMPPFGPPPPGERPEGGPPHRGPHMGPGVWRRNAYFGEKQTFDACLGHQPPNGEYHNHANPTCLRYQLNDNLEQVSSARTGPTFREKASGLHHSPILGWAFDGFPIYGPYGYSDPTNPNSSVKRLRSSFELRRMTERTSLPDWALPNHQGVSAELKPAQYGPRVSAEYPLGRYVEDFKYVKGLGELDQYNGRFEVTPDFPKGTYAYHITIDEKGDPAFPYIFGGQLYGNVTGGRAAVPASGVEEYFSASSKAPKAAATSPSLASWLTNDSNQDAKVISGYDPSAGAQATWPTNVPPDAEFAGGVEAPSKADVQRVRYTDSQVFVEAHDLPSYPIGPWFDGTMAGGIFSNFPAQQNYEFAFPRQPVEANDKSASGMGPQGMWVNGVTVFNFLDGASYDTSAKRDSGGGGVFPTATIVSAVSGENGPAAPGSLLVAHAILGAQLAKATASAPTGGFATELGGLTLTVEDAKGVSHTALLSYVSPNQVNYRLPLETAAGFATLTFHVAGKKVPANLYVVSSYPHLLSEDGCAKGSVMQSIHGEQTVTLYGSGLGDGSKVSATIGGVSAKVISFGPEKTTPGMDFYTLEVPPALTRKAAADVVVTVNGRPSNTVSVLLP